MKKIIKNKSLFNRLIVIFFVITILLFLSINLFKTFSEDVTDTSSHITGDTIYVNGPTKLEGRLVKTSDLRAGAALILAALSAHGETTITDIKHLLRGYSHLIQKLSNVGAKIWLEDEYH
jgi:hypothetical protein